MGIFCNIVAALMRMPWGKHKGLEFGEIPDSYLLWVLDKADYATPSLKSAIRKHFGIEDPEPEEPDTPSSNVASMEMVVKAWWRRMTLKFHPDRGGSIVAFQTINEAHEHLKQLAGLK